MAIVIVTSATPGAGKTGVATAIARHYAYQGRPVRLVRLAGEGSADADAAHFSSLAFVPGSSAKAATEAPADDPAAITVVEAAPEAANIPGATVVLVARGEAPKSAPAGLKPAATVVTDVPRASATASGPAILISEDQTLAGFSVEEARTALNADVIAQGDDMNATCDRVVVASISSDAGQPYFRRFGSKAVVVRFDRTDMHLAAMQTAPECLILTGGRQPSGYLFDAAGARGIPVLLSRTDTENTVIALEGIFDRTRFQGERKLDRMAALLESTSLWEALAL